MKKLAVVPILLCALEIIALAAGRILTHDAEPYFGRIFPRAVAFSPFGGTPPHYIAYAEDPAKNPAAKPIGYVFWTTDVVPEESGYRAPIHILVGMDTSGIIAGAIVDYHAEPYGYFSIEPPEFAAQFKGKSIRDPLTLGIDIHGVSRASISTSSATRAIRNSSRAMARQFLTPDAVKE